MTASPILSPIKFCNKCQCETDRYARGGCKPCAVVQATKWRNKNQDKEKIIKANYYKRHIDASKQRGANYYEKNKESVCKRSRAWADANPDKVIESKKKHASSGKEAVTKRAYQSKNEERLKHRRKLWLLNNIDSVRRSVQNRRARRNDSEGTLSKDIAERLLTLQRGKCACCSQPLGSNYELDHIMPLALGGPNTDNNIQLLRRKCNRQKHAKHPIDFMQSRGFLL